LKKHTFSTLVSNGSVIHLIMQDGEKKSVIDVVIANRIIAIITPNI